MFLVDKYYHDSNTITCHQEILDKLLDTFDKTLNTISQLLASQPATLKVETAGQPIIKQTTNKPVSTKTIVDDRLVTKKQIRAMFGYNFDFLI